MSDALPLDEQIQRLSRLIALDDGALIELNLTIGRLTERQKLIQGQRDEKQRLLDWRLSKRATDGDRL